MRLLLLKEGAVLFLKEDSLLTAQPAKAFTTAHHQKVAEKAPFSEGRPRHTASHTTESTCLPAQPTDSEESQDEEVAVVAATSVASVAETLEADNIVPLTPKREREGAAPVVSTRSMVRAVLGPPPRFDSRDHACAVSGLS